MPQGGNGSAHRHIQVPQGWWDQLERHFESLSAGDNIDTLGRRVKHENGLTNTQ